VFDVFTSPDQLVPVANILYTGALLLLGGLGGYCFARRRYYDEGFVDGALYGESQHPTMDLAPLVKKHNEGGAK
jgi:hypothetical protein